MERGNIEKSKNRDVRLNNLVAVQMISNVIKTSLGPRGMDKIIEGKNEEVLVTNDGATILSRMNVVHPASKIFVEMSKSQDIEAGDGTTTVVVIAEALAQSAIELLEMGLHPSNIAENFKMCSSEVGKYLKEISQKVELHDKNVLLRLAKTSLCSKVINQYSDVIAPIAVNAILSILDDENQRNVDLKKIRIVKIIGETIDSSGISNGLILNQTLACRFDAVKKIENAKVALIQFQLSNPKTNIDHQIIVNDLSQIDQLFKDEEIYVRKLINHFRRTGCNVLLIQKSILRDAVSNSALQILGKLGFMVIKDIEREDVEFICQTLDCQPIARIENFDETRLGHVGCVEEITTDSGAKYVKFTGHKIDTRTTTVLLRGSNNLVLDECERSLHDALCVLRCIVKEPFILPGGGASEAYLSLKFSQLAENSAGIQKIFFTKFSEAISTIPYVLSENAGLNSIEIVSQLKDYHKAGKNFSGIDVKTAKITDMFSLNIIQPFIVTFSAVNLATETVNLLLKIDDILQSR